MNLDRYFTDPQIGSNLFVEHALDNHRHHLPLAGGQRVVPALDLGKLCALLPRDAVPVERLTNSGAIGGQLAI